MTADKRYYWKNREKKLAATKAWRDANRERVRQKRKEEYQRQITANPNINKERYAKEREKRVAYARRTQERNNDLRRLRETGHTKEWFVANWDLQGGRCAICSNGLEPARAHADHNHTTKKPRGVLCRTCNLGLGHFRDSPDLLIAAAGYLRFWA